MDAYADFLEMYDSALELARRMHRDAGELEMQLHANMLLQRELGRRFGELDAKMDYIEEQITAMNRLGGVTGNKPMELGIGLTKVIAEATVLGEWMQYSHNSVAEAAKMLSEQKSSDYNG